MKWLRKYLFFTDRQKYVLTGFAKLPWTKSSEANQILLSRKRERENSSFTRSGVGLRLPLPLAGEGRGEGILYAALFIASILCLLLPSDAFAYTVTEGFRCEGGQPVGKLFEAGGTCDIAAETIFSGLVCNFESLISEIFSYLYCGMNAALLKPVTIVLTIFIVVFGILFTTGITPLTASEALKALLKFALVWAFATEAEYAIGIAYNFFMTVASEGITLVLSAVKPPGVTGEWNMDGAIRHMDEIVWHAISPPETTRPADFCTRSVLALTTLLLVILPPVFLLIMYTAVQTVMVFARAMLGYLMALAGITFLMTISPIFFAFALFKTTFHLFEKWLHYMITFALQMVIVFAFIALVEMISIGNFFGAMLDLVVPYEPNWWPAFGRFFWTACTICQHTFVPDVHGMDIPVCLPPGADGKIPAIPPLQLVNHSEFIILLVTKLMALLILTYAMEAFLRHVPEVAKQLSGPIYAPRLGGMSGGAPGFGAAGTISARLPGTNAMEAIREGARQGWSRGTGYTPSRIFAAAMGARAALRTAPLQGNINQLQRLAKNALPKAEKSAGLPRTDWNSYGLQRQAPKSTKSTPKNTPPRGGRAK